MVAWWAMWCGRDVCACVLHDNGGGCVVVLYDVLVAAVGWCWCPHCQSMMVMWQPRRPSDPIYLVSPLLNVAESRPKLVGSLWLGFKSVEVGKYKALGESPTLRHGRCLLLRAPFLHGDIVEEFFLTTGSWLVRVGSGVGGCWVDGVIPRVRWSDLVRVWVKDCGRRRRQQRQRHFPS